MPQRYSSSPILNGSRLVHQELAGQVLVAHPSCEDVQFKESVVFLSGHCSKVGSVGFIINRPTGKTLSQVNSSYTYSPLARVPVLHGGPVMTSEVFFVSWQWFESQNRFTCQVAVTEAHAGAMLQGHDSHTEVWAIQGYAGWNQGQIEQELHSQYWFCAKLNVSLLKTVTHQKLWLNYLKQMNPQGWNLAQISDQDPFLN